MLHAPILSDGATTHAVVEKERKMGDYPLLPIPPAYRSPSGERGQILLDGLAMKVSLFHGKVDDEADWHVYIDPQPSVWQTLGAYLRERGTQVSNADLGVMYCELMVCDRHRNPLFDEFFDSADVTLAFRLSKPGSQHPAWDLGLYAGDHQGTNHDFSRYSRLVRDSGRVYLQGAFVNDAAHGTRVEIHPLDSIAFAMDSAGRTLPDRWGEPGWPRRYVKWRVVVFANSKFHRINGENYMKKERTTTWYLDLPGDAGTGGPTSLPTSVTVEEIRQPLWDGKEEAWYTSRRVKSFAPWALAADPRDGRKKLKVSATMKIPDTRGGLVVRDYIVRVARDVFKASNKTSR